MSTGLVHVNDKAKAVPQQVIDKWARKCRDGSALALVDQAGISIRQIHRRIGNGYQSHGWAMNWLRNMYVDQDCDKPVFALFAAVMDRVEAEQE